MAHSYNKNVMLYAMNNVNNKNSFSTKGHLFGIVKILYLIACVYSAIMSLAVMLGSLVYMDEYSPKTTPNMVSAYNEHRLYVILMAFIIAVIICCVIFLVKRFAIFLAVFGCINCIVSFTVFYGVSVTNDIKNGGMSNFWVRFGIPSIVCTLISIILAVLIIIEKVKIKRLYDKIVEKLYSVYISQNGDNSDSTSFEEYLNNYKGEEIFRTDIPLKKSVRKRKEKQDLDK